MATFKFVGRDIDIHWNGYDIVGPAETVFSIPDQLYEEFEGDIRGVEPSLTWIDTNEFQTLKDSVPTGTYVKAAIGQSPISVSTSSQTATISLNSGTALNGYLLVANGTGGTIWNPASTSGLTSVVGISPISSTISGGTVSVSLSANYQTSGIYVTSVSGTSPISASGTTAITVSIDSSILTAENAVRMRTYVRNATASTIAKGSVVYLDGSNGTVPSIQKALANADATSARTFGIVEFDITSNSNGYVTNQGLLSPLDTSTVADGAVLWLSPTVAGAFTTTKPAGPNHGVLVGIVVKGTSVGAGSVYVLIKNGAELDEIHDVNISSLASGQALIYSSTASVWQNALIGSASISTGAVTSGHIAAGAVGTAALATGAVTSIKIAAGAVDTAALGTAAVISAKIAASAVTSGHIAAGAVGSAAIATGSINSTHLGAGSVGASQIIDASITSAELADNAVVAAKIAANAVGITKIDSGSATNGQVITADGTGGASYTTVSSSALSVTLNTTTVNNTIPEFVRISASTLSGMPASGSLRVGDIPVAYDATNHQIYIAYATQTGSVAIATMKVAKIDATSGTQISSVNITMNTSTTNIETISGIAYGNGKLCLFTSSSVSTVAPISRYFILNSSLSTIASGNVHPTGHGGENTLVSSLASQDYRYHVRYDEGADKFVIMAGYNPGTTNALRNYLYRIIDPSLTTTGYYIGSATLSVGASTATTQWRTDQIFTTPLVWIPSLSRWVIAWSYNTLTGSPRNNAISIHSFSVSPTTTAVLVPTGRQLSTSFAGGTGALGDSASPSLIATDDALLFGSGSGTIYKILISDISANINTASSAEVPTRYINNSSIANAGEATGKGSLLTQYKSSGSTKWFIAENSSSGIDVCAYDAFINQSNTTSATISGSGLTTPYNVYVGSTLTSVTDAFVLCTNNAYSATQNATLNSFDSGIYNGSLYVVSSMTTSSDVTGAIIRVTKVGDYSQPIVTIHSTATGTEMIYSGSIVYNSVCISLPIGDFYSTGSPKSIYGMTGAKVYNSGDLLGYYVYSSVSSSSTAVMSTDFYKVK